MLQTTSKDEQKVVLKKLKEEQRRKMALLGEQYEQTIAEMLQKQSVGRTTIPFNERRTSLECCLTADPAGRVAGARGGPAADAAAAAPGAEAGFASAASSVLAPPSALRAWPSQDRRSQ